MKTKTNNRLFFSGGVKTGIFLALAPFEFKIKNNQEVKNNGK